MPSRLRLRARVSEAGQRETPRTFGKRKEARQGIGSKHPHRRGFPSVAIRRKSPHLTGPLAGYHTPSRGKGESPRGAQKRAASRSTRIPSQRPKRPWKTPLGKANAQKRAPHYHSAPYQLASGPFNGESGTKHQCVKGRIFLCVCPARLEGWLDKRAAGDYTMEIFHPLGLRSPNVHCHPQRAGRQCRQFVA